MKQTLILFFLVIVGAITGCAPASAPVSGQSAIIANKTVESPPPNAAVIQVLSARLQHAPMCLDGQKLGVLKWGTRAHIVVRPGPHTISASNPDEQDCSKDHYLVTNYNFTAAAGKSHLLIMEDGNKMQFAILEIYLNLFS